MDQSLDFSEYTQLLAQQKAIFSASAEMLRMYWDIGELLYHK